MAVWKGGGARAHKQFQGWFGEGCEKGAESQRGVDECLVGEAWAGTQEDWGLTRATPEPAGGGGEAAPSPLGGGAHMPNS